MKVFVVGLGVLASIAVAQSTQPPTVSRHIAKILSRANGASEATAYKVSSVRDEYEIIKALGLTPGSQALVIRKKPYDRITATDPATGAEREVWFDISSFYPEF